MPNTHPQHNREWSTPHAGEMGSRQSPLPTSEGRRSPNGRRSYQERITTVRFLHPSTGETMCTKLNRVQRTKTKPENDAQLCESFLKGHCDAGNACPFVHVPKQYLWRLLRPHVDPSLLLYYPGFNIRCYTPDMDVYYDIPSEFIYQTRGSDRYVELFNDNGDNFKDKCRLCVNLQSHGMCELNEECDDIHCAVADLDRFPHIGTHRASRDAVLNYEHMPSELVIRVYQPNTPGDGVDYSGDDVLRTAGATQYEEAYRLAGDIPSLKMQHCAHFQTKKLCRMGDGCRFLHVVSVALASPAPEEEASMRSSPASAATPPLASTTGAPRVTGASPTSATKTSSVRGSPSGEGRLILDEDAAMNEAAEMAALAMASEEPDYIGSATDNMATVGDGPNGSAQKDNIHASAAAPLRQSPQQSSPPPPPQQSSQPAPPHASIYPYRTVSLSAVNGRISPVQYRSSGRLSPIRVLVSPDQMEAGSAPRLSPTSPPFGGGTGTPTQQPQSRTSPVRRNNPYFYSPSSSTLN